MNDQSRTCLSQQQNKQACQRRQIKKGDKTPNLSKEKRASKTAIDEHYKMDCTLRNFSPNSRNRTFTDSKTNYVHHLSESFNPVIKSGGEKKKPSATKCWFDGQPGTKTRKVVAMAEPARIDRKIKENWGWYAVTEMLLALEQVWQSCNKMWGGNKGS